MTTTVDVSAPGYAGKKVLVLVNDGKQGPWKRVAVLSQGQKYTTVATDSQGVQVQELTDEQFAELEAARED